MNHQRKFALRWKAKKKSPWNVYTVLIMTVIILGFAKMVLDMWER